MKLTGAKLAEFLGLRVDRPICAITYRGAKDRVCRSCFVAAADAYYVGDYSRLADGRPGSLCIQQFLVTFELDRLIVSATGGQLFSRHPRTVRLPGGAPLSFGKRTNKAGLWWVSGPEECPALERPLTVYEAAFLDSWADWGEGFDPCPRDGWRVADGAAAVHARKAAPYPLTRSQLEIEEEREREIAKALLVARRAEARAARAATLRGLVKRWTTKAKRAETMIAKYSRVLKRLEKGGL